MISSSWANELPGAAAVRPAMVESSWNPPWVAMSQWTMPFGPRADQATIASSTSVSGSTACSEANASGPFGWCRLCPVAAWVSWAPLSMWYPRATRRLRSVESRLGSVRVCSKKALSCRCSSAVGADAAWVTAMAPPHRASQAERAAG